jgi:predicted HicB family RNase H-like nuclease
MATHKVKVTEEKAQRNKLTVAPIEQTLQASIKIAAIRAGMPLYKWVASALEEKLQGEATND